MMVLYFPTAATRCGYIALPVISRVSGLHVHHRAEPIRAGEARSRKYLPARKVHKSNDCSQNNWPLVLARINLESPRSLRATDSASKFYSNLQTYVVIVSTTILNLKAKNRSCLSKLRTLEKGFHAAIETSLLAEDFHPWETRRPIESNNRGVRKLRRACKLDNIIPVHGTPDRYT